MKALLARIAAIVYAYGKNGACVPSWHGSYEGEVPQSLRNCDEE